MYSKTVIQSIENVRSQGGILDFSKKEIVIANLVFVYQVITASESLLELAFELSDGELKEYYRLHLEEERCHEKWLSDDLLMHGVDVKKLPLSRIAVAMAGSQYYLVKHVSPACLLGYMAVLEGFPVEIGTVELLEEAHGSELFRTLRYHCEHDLEHRKDLFEMIDKFQDDEIMRNAIQTATYMNEFTSELNGK